MKQNKRCNKSFMNKRRVWRLNRDRIYKRDVNIECGTKIRDKIQFKKILALG